MENKYTVIIEATFNEGGMQSEEFKEYSAKALAAATPHGGVVVAKHGITENIAQGETPHAVSIIEFPSKEKAIAALKGEEYTSIIPLREIVFKEVKILFTKE